MPSPARSTPGSPAACTASQSRTAPAAWAASATAATGWPVPTSLLAAITATRAVRPAGAGRPAGPGRPGRDRRPGQVDRGPGVGLGPGGGVEHGVVLDGRADQVPALRRPASTVPLTARLSASVPPEVNTTSAGAALTRAANCSRADSTAARAARPWPCWLDGLAAGRPAAAASPPGLPLAAGRWPRSRGTARGLLTFPPGCPAPGRGFRALPVALSLSPSPPVFFLLLGGRRKDRVGSSSGGFGQSRAPGRPWPRP